MSAQKAAQHRIVKPTLFLSIVQSFFRALVEIACDTDPLGCGTEKFKNVQLTAQKHLDYRTTMSVAINK